jgi:Glucodextranase, domain B
MNQNIKKIVKMGSLSIFFILIIIYAFFISKDLIFGVKIRNVNLSDGATVPENVIKLTGSARNAIKLTLDGREISVDQQGNFNETIALLPGYNIINIKAQDKFGYIDEKNYKLMH